MLTSMLVALCLALGVPAAPSAADVRPPPPGTEVDYQLGGAYRLPDGVRVVTRDRTDPPARSGYSICYVNAYQTQPGTLRWWRDHHSRLLLRDDGALVHDPLADWRETGLGAPRNAPTCATRCPWIRASRHSAGRSS